MEMMGMMEMMEMSPEPASTPLINLNVICCSKRGLNDG